MSYQISEVSFCVCAKQRFKSFTNKSYIHMELQDPSTLRDGYPERFWCNYKLGTAHYDHNRDAFEIDMTKDKRNSPDRGRCPSTAKLAMYNDGTGRITLESESSKVIAEGEFYPKQVSNAIDKLSFGMTISLLSK